jgi:predicted ester cyclase
MATSPDAVVRQWFQEVWNEGREEAIDRLMDPDAMVYGLGGPEGHAIRGPQAFKPFFQMFQRALGNLQITVERTVVEGDTCAAQCRVKARHIGPTLGGPPTDREVEFGGMVIATVRDGQLVEGWNCFDFLSMYQQLGWVKNPPLPYA